LYFATRRYHSFGFLTRKYSRKAKKRTEGVFELNLSLRPLAKPRVPLYLFIGSSDEREAPLSAPLACAENNLKTESDTGLEDK